MNDNLLSVKDKKIIITGANGYFGRTFVKELYKLGARVIAITRSEGFKEFLKENDLTGVKDYYVDFFDREKLKEVLKTSIKENGPIDVLINNAYNFSYETGFNTRDGEFEKIDDEKYFKAMESGVYWPFVACQIVGGSMKDSKKGGSIINISSMYGAISPDPGLYEGKEIFNPVTYSMSKAAILALTRYIASFWGPYGISCNAVLPGAFPNVGGDTYNSNSDEEMLRRLENKTCVGRVGQPIDLIGTITLLSSDSSSYITGQSIVVDGGWSIK